MFKNLNGNFSKLFSGNKWVIFLVVIVLLFLLYSYSQSKGSFLDKMTDGTPTNMVSSNKESTVDYHNQMPQAPTSGNVSTIPSNNNYMLQPIANPSELLPKDKNSEWASLNPVSVGGASGIQTPDLLQSGYHIGIDTIGQTLKNPSYDLRSDPIIEKKSVSPWNMSTIEPDFARVPLEVGYGSR